MAGFFAPILKKLGFQQEAFSEEISNYNSKHIPSTESFELVDDRSINQASFDRIKDQIGKWLRQKKEVSDNFFLETGKLNSKRSYLYFQRWGKEGWLLEPSTGGWILSRAVKIAHQDQFLRQESCWEAATLLTDEKSKQRFAVYSSRYSEEPMCLAIYEDYLLEDLERSF